jgi:hypothetical protein
MTRPDLAPRPTFRQKQLPRVSDAPVRKPPVWRGVDWSASVGRTGCQDFLACPSRRGDDLVEYRPPILNAASYKP